MTFFWDRAHHAIALFFVVLVSTGSLAGAQQSSNSDQTTAQTESSQIDVGSEQPGPLFSSSSDPSLPDDPDVLLDTQQSTPPPPAQPANGQDQSMQGRQTKRILDILPNFRAVSADTRLPPQSVKEKFVTAAQDSVDYSSFIFIALQAGLGQLDSSYPEFGQGAAGYGRYYWHTFADGTDENLWVEFIIPTLLRQDTRYYTLGHGGFPKRLVYAVSRAFITRNDAGRETFNSSEIFGAGIAAGISNFYYPEQERTGIKTYQRWVTNVSIDDGVFILKEFWPDINNKFFHQKD